MHPANSPIPIPSSATASDARGTPVPAGLEPLTGMSTAYFGRVFPAVWTTAVGMFTGAVWLDLLPDGPAPTAVKWALLTAWVAVSAIIIRYFGSLQHVWRHGDELVVGGAGRGVRIHLGDVLEIKESRFQQIKTVTLKLRRPTPLGDNISFVPKGMGPFFFPLMSSGAAERLRQRQKELVADQHRLVGRS